MLTAQSLEPASVSVSPFLSASPSLSKIDIKKVNKNKRQSAGIYYFHLQPVSKLHPTAQPQGLPVLLQGLRSFTWPPKVHYHPHPTPQEPHSLAPGLHLASSSSQVRLSPATGPWHVLFPFMQVLHCAHPLLPPINTDLSDCVPHSSLL